MHAVTMRIEHRSVSRAENQRAHDIRKGRLPDYVNADRSQFNSTIIQPLTGFELRHICEDRRSKAGDRKRAMKSDAAVATTGIIGFSHSAQSIVQALSTAEQDRLFLEHAQAIAEKLGTTLHGLVVHRDETALHGHFQLAAVREDGKPVSKVTTPANLSNLQDHAAECWSSIGLTRGKRKKDRIQDGEPMHKWVHRSVKQLHEDLPQEIERLALERDQAHALLLSLHEQVDQLTNERDSAQQVVQELNSTVTTQQKALDQLGAEYSQLEQHLAKISGDLTATRDELARIEPIRKAGGMFGQFVDSVTGTKKQLLNKAQAYVDKERLARRQAEAVAKEAKEQAANAQLEVNPLRMSVKKLEKKNHDLANNLTDMETVVKTKDYDIAALQEELDLTRQVLERIRAGESLHDIESELPGQSNGSNYSPR